MAGFLAHVMETLRDALIAVLVPLPFFALLGLAVKGRALFADIRRAATQSRINLLLHFLDALLVAPVLLVMSIGMADLSRSYGLYLVDPGFWSGVPVVVTAFVAVFLGDFIAYWRHRLEHTPLFWPSHAVHHSDTEMTWLTVVRFHPINRLSTTGIDYAFLLLFGLPPFALVANNIVRHYYGAFIHADLPWTYGPLGRVFVSPAMHRWHHSVSPSAYNTNFASIFSVFDQAFGTFLLPGPCTTAVGVPDRMGEGVFGQIAYPLKPSSYRYFRKSLSRWIDRRFGRAGSGGSGG